MRSAATSPKSVRRASTILVIDDHEDTLLLFTKILGDSGYQVKTARHGHEGVSLARLHRPMVIVMDLAMPEMDGWTTAETLKRAPETQGVPIIAVTARSERHDIDRAYAAGCDSVLLKPLDPERLVKAVDVAMLQLTRG